MEISNIYQKIENRLIFDKQIFTLAIWRDENSSVSRKVATGAGLSLISLCRIIDSITSVALGILSVPFMLIGIKLTQSFVGRATMSLGTSLGLLTFYQYVNFSKDSLFENLHALDINERYTW